MAGTQKHPPRSTANEEAGEATAPRSSPTRRGQAATDLALAVALAPTAGRGQPVAAATRAPVENQLGMDLADARVHVGPAAAAAAQQAEARAVTSGPDVVLGAGESVGSSDLIAHELAHVAQWKAAPGVRTGWSSAGDAHESHAAAVAHDVASGAAPTAGAMPPGPVPAASRQPAGQPAAAPATPAPAPARTPDEEIVAAGQAPTTPATAWRASMHAFNLIMHHRFPGPERSWYTGTSFDAAETGVRANTAQGTNGRVQFVLGTQFARDTTTALLESRVADVRRQLVAVFNWRIGLGILTADDMTIPLVREQLRATQPAELRRIRAVATIEPGARDEIDRLLAISTPLPADAQLAAGGTATLTVRGVTVRILPDITAGSENETRADVIPETQTVPGFDFENGRITNIAGPLPQVPDVEVQTRYAATGPHAPTDPVTDASAYGRGTTAQDQASGNTSLRFHEGSHGTDVLEYLAATPYRVFRGRVGMTVTAWNAERRAFIRAHVAWVSGMDRFSTCRTDCVGPVTKDDYHSAEPGYQLRCTTCP